MSSSGSGRGKRERFHGAFTGGFSAGYFNTVGSEEGFQPTSFISSRNARAEKKQRTVFDVIDDEDGDLGMPIASKKEYCSNLCFDTIV